MRFFSLLHIKEKEQSLHNNGFVRSFRDQIILYFTCAKKLHLSLKSVGIDLVLLTNDKEYLLALNADGYKIEIVQLDFRLKVPPGIKFYSAHFKIETFTYLASLKDEYIGLLDCDIVCINEIPECFKNAISKKTPLYYDITDQIIPAYGPNRIIGDKEKLGNQKSLGLWAGGEFISGPPEFFSRLYTEIDNLKEEYFKHFNSFHHQGDEMLTSVAIENIMLNSNLRIMDAGALSIIARFWSPKPLHIQKSVEAYSSHFLIHLPSDKTFISKLNDGELKGKLFLQKYKSHLFRMRLVEKALSGIKPYIKKLRKV